MYDDEKVVTAVVFGTIVVIVGIVVRIVFGSTIVCAGYLATVISVGIILAALANGNLPSNLREWEPLQYALVLILVAIAVFGAIVFIQPFLGEPFSTINRSLTNV